VSDKSTFNCLSFVAKYEGERRKAFMGYLYDFSEHKLPMRRAPFTLDTISRLISEGLITREGRVKLTVQGRVTLSRLEARATQPSKGSGEP
jgi:hypothetical protein